MTVSRFNIEKMDCTAEEQLVRMRLAQLDGIDHVGVDLTAREVTVEHAGDTAVIAAALDSLDLGTSHIGDGSTGPALYESSSCSSMAQIVCGLSGRDFLCLLHHLLRQGQCMPPNLSSIIKERPNK